ncbi:MAG: NADH-quinone oxidoreductase subunit L [Candidatus Rariloculaceae bacterium]
MSIYTLIPLLPLVAAVTLALFGRRLDGSGHRIVVLAVAGSFVISVAAFMEVLANGAINVSLYRLLEVDRLVVDLGFYIDSLTVLLLFLVTGVSTVVQIYASRYMIGDARHSRFFALTALFTSAMTVLVMSSNLLLTFIFWEVMGLCSYLLISHYAARLSAGRAATKVFLVNSIADAGLLIGVILTFHAFGTLDIPEIISIAQSDGEISPQLITILTLCLFAGAVGKSAQMPAHVWLPLAMEAPTPVSALIHAATMVNAGPFLLVRLSPVIVLSETTMTVIATIGGITALFAAIVSLTQTDIKRTLAYSTISQLGFMTLLCGVGAFVAAIFHLLAHGFFKAFFFLSTGNALAGTHRHFDLHDEEQPSSSGGLFAGALVLSVIPPLVIFSGPYQHLWFSQSFSTAGVAFWIVGLATVFFTAMAISKCVAAVFRQGPPGVNGAAPQVTPALFSFKHIFVVLVALAALVTLLLFVWRWFAAFLSPSVGAAVQTVSEPASGFSMLILVPIAVAVGGWAVAYAQRGRPHAHETAAWKKRLYVFFLNKGYFDEIYDVYIVQPTLRTANWLWRVIDQGVVDRLIVSLGPVSVSISRWLWQVIDMGIFDRIVNAVGSRSVWLAKRLETVDRVGIAENERLGRGVDASGQALQGFQPRTLQHDLLVVVFWLAAALGFFYWIA